MIIGVDDTDSIHGGCTSYLGAVMYEQMLKYCVPLDLPHLIRLNPNIPYKTRGNGAISISVDPLGDPQQIKDLAIQLVEQLSWLEDPQTHPGLVFLERITPQIIQFARASLNSVLNTDLAKKLILKSGGEYYGLKKSRGIIGALAAAGMPLVDFSYELIGYRYPESWGTSRYIKPESVMAAELESFPETWDNYDWENSRIRISPNSPCPVLFGIRGSSPEAIIRACSLLDSEPIHSWMLFKTNQSLDEHIQWNPAELREFGCYALQGTLSKDPWEIRGGHLFLELKLPNGSKIKCAAFEPTKQFRNWIRNLIQGDEVIAYGSLMRGCLNLEKLELIKPRKLELNPICSRCNRIMESMGRSKGFRCRKCGARQNSKRLIPRDPRIYEVAVSARRHLSKPLAIFDPPGFLRAQILR